LTFFDSGAASFQPAQWPLKKMLARGPRCAFSSGDDGQPMPGTATCQKENTTFFTFSQDRSKMAYRGQLGSYATAQFPANEALNFKSNPLIG